MNIRQAKSTDANRLTEIAIQSKAHWGYSKQFMDSCRDELVVTVEKIDSDSFHYWLIESTTEVHGFYAIENLQNGEYELEALFVAPQSIGKGVGKSLMLHAIEYAKSLGVTELKIQSDPNAEKFYLDLGAENIGYQESQSIAGRKLPLLVLKL